MINVQYVAHLKLPLRVFYDITSMVRDIVHDDLSGKVAMRATSAAEKHIGPSRNERMVPLENSENRS